jgi:hypothetical protein
LAKYSTVGNRSDHHNLRRFFKRAYLSCRLDSGPIRQPVIHEQYVGIMLVGSGDGGSGVVGECDNLNIVFFVEQCFEAERDHMMIIDDQHSDRLTLELVCHGGCPILDGETAKATDVPTGVLSHATQISCM